VPESDSGVLNFLTLESESHKNKDSHITAGKTRVKLELCAEIMFFFVKNLAFFHRKMKRQINIRNLSEFYHT